MRQERIPIDGTVSESTQKAGKEGLRDRFPPSDPFSPHSLSAPSLCAPVRVPWAVALRPHVGLAPSSRSIATATPRPRSDRLDEQLGVRYLASAAVRAMPPSSRIARIVPWFEHCIRAGRGCVDCECRCANVPIARRREPDLPVAKRQLGAGEQSSSTIAALRQRSERVRSVCRPRSGQQLHGLATPQPGSDRRDEHLGVRYLARTLGCPPHRLEDFVLAHRMDVL